MLRVTRDTRLWEFNGQINLFRISNLLSDIILNIQFQTLIYIPGNFLFRAFIKKFQKYSCKNL